MWGNRVIVPTKLRGRVLETLHEGHMGTVKMKGLARGYVWWPRMDEDIEGVTKRCEGCQGVANNQKQAPLHRWEYPAHHDNTCISILQDHFKAKCSWS